MPSLTSGVTRPPLVVPALQKPGLDPADAPQGQRFLKFLEWIRIQTDCVNTFVLDGEGLVLVSHQEDSDLVAIASSMISLLQRLQRSLDSPTGNFMTLALRGRETLYFSQIDLEWSRFTLGVVSQKSISSSLMRSFETKLIRIIDLETS